MAGLPLRKEVRFHSMLGHYLYSQIQFGEDRCTQFRVIVVTDPQTHPQTQTYKQTNKPTDRIDYNTLRC